MVTILLLPPNILHLGLVPDPILGYPTSLVSVSTRLSLVSVSTTTLLTNQRYRQVSQNHLSLIKKSYAEHYFPKIFFELVSLKFHKLFLFYFGGGNKLENTFVDQGCVKLIKSYSKHMFGPIEEKQHMVLHGLASMKPFII